MKFPYCQSEGIKSSSWITDPDGQAIQHLQYLPFGESFIDQRISSFGSRYTFSAKEKDEETGYGYFGARYYSSDLSIWLSIDPMSDKYPSTSPYAYCNNNPIRITDPNGMEWEIDGVKYVPGQACPEDAAQNTKDKWSTMNDIYKTENGKKTIDEMNVEGVMYNVSSETAGNGGGGYLSNKDGSGGTIYTNGNDKHIGMLSHEVFHGYQDMKGQGGASIFNEVEAYMFSYSVSGVNKLSASSQNYNYTYNRAVNELLLNSKFDGANFDTVVNGFKNYAPANKSGLYNNQVLQRNNQTKNLINSFYPLK